MSEQEIREKVINGLVCNLNFITKSDCEQCGYNCEKTMFLSVPVDLLADTLALLKAQGPRVMTWEEAQTNVQNGPFVIFEVRNNMGSKLDFGVLVGKYYEMSNDSLLTVCDFDMLKDDYGKRFRCWTSRPDEKRRAETPWN